MVIATDGHFASSTAALRKNRLRRKRIGVFGVHTPMPELVEALNAFRPAILAPYAGMGALLATEQHAGRLHIDPMIMAPSFGSGSSFVVRRQIVTPGGFVCGAGGIRRGRTSGA